MPSTLNPSEVDALMEAIRRAMFPSLKEARPHRDNNNKTSKRLNTISGKTVLFVGNSPHWIQ